LSSTAGSPAVSTHGPPGFDPAEDLSEASGAGDGSGFDAPAGEGSGVGDAVGLGAGVGVVLGSGVGVVASGVAVAAGVAEAVGLGEDEGEASGVGEAAGVGDGSVVGVGVNAAAGCALVVASPDVGCGEGVSAGVVSGALASGVEGREAEATAGVRSNSSRPLTEPLLRRL
jgi:hypothetical protein